MTCSGIISMLIVISVMIISFWTDTYGANTVDPSQRSSVICLFFVIMSVSYGGAFLSILGGFLLVVQNFNILQYHFLQVQVF